MNNTNKDIVKFVELSEKSKNQGYELTVNFDSFILTKEMFLLDFSTLSDVDAFLSDATPIERFMTHDRVSNFHDKIDNIINTPRKCLVKLNVGFYDADADNIPKIDVYDYEAVDTESVVEEIKAELLGVKLELRQALLDEGLSSETNMIWKSFFTHR